MSTDRISEHIERCVELYGMPLDDDFAGEIKREHYEQMRADLLLMVGMATALRALAEGRTPSST